MNITVDPVGATIVLIFLFCFVSISGYVVLSSMGKQNRSGRCKKKLVGQTDQTQTKNTV